MFFYAPTGRRVATQIVQENPDKLWDYYDLSRNPNITWKIVQENPEKPWDYNNLSKNTFNYRKYNWSKKLHKYYSKKIKREIIHLIWCWKKTNILNILPKDILYMILSILY